MSRDVQSQGKCSADKSFKYYITFRRPTNAQELFNLRHASSRNVIERIFGILKNRFRILLLPPEYDMGTQARIPPALCALHNFIRHHDPLEIIDFDNEVGSEDDEGDEDDEGEAHGEGEGEAQGEGEGEARSEHGELSSSAVGPHERERAGRKRDEIANEMWDQYQQFLLSGDYQEVEP
jgi:DDE superfamily endonuclease